MHNETITRGLAFPYCPSTSHNIANLKLHMVKKICPNKLPGAKTVPREDIVEHNKALEMPQKNDGVGDFKRGTFERAELLFGRINAPNQAEGVVCGRNMCTETTDAKQKLRKHLSAMHRKTNTGEV